MERKTELLKKDEQFVWHPFTQMKTAGIPLEIVKAKKSYLYDADDQKYLDCNSSWWTNVHGHGNKHIRKAINKQFKTLDHVIFAGATHPKAVELAEKVAGILPDSLQKVFFSDNGSTAVEVALKMAFQFWHNSGVPRKRILAMEGAYHGDTFGAMSVGQRGYFNEPFEHLFFDVDFLPFPTVENESTLLENARNLFETNEFAAIIVEPLVQGSAGMRMYSTDFLDKLSSLAKAHDVLVIFDEVMTAWGRTGKLFAMDHCQQKPDIVCLSKGLTGGVLPLGLTVATEKIYNAFLDDSKLKALLHGHSFTGNALSCAAACASIEIFAKEETFEKIRAIEKSHRNFLKQLATKENIENPRLCGTILAFEITSEKEGYFSSVSSDAHVFFLKRGMFVRTLGNTVFLNPPYSFTEKQLKKCYSALMDFALLT